MSRLQRSLFAELNLYLLADLSDLQKQVLFVCPSLYVFGMPKHMFFVWHGLTNCVFYYGLQYNTVLVFYVSRTQVCRRKLMSTHSILGVNISLHLQTCVLMYDKQRIVQCVSACPHMNLYVPGWHVL